MTGRPTTPIEVDNPLKEKSWVMTPKGVGLFSGYTNPLRPARPTCSVQFGYEQEMFEQEQVRPCTFVEFCLQPTGFGQMPWVAFVLIVAGCAGVWMAGWPWWTAVMAVAVVGGTYMNFKRFWV